MRKTPTSSPSDPIQLESVVTLDQDLDRRVKRARQQAELRIQQAKHTAEGSVGEEKERSARRCSIRLEERKQQWLREAAQASQDRMQQDSRIVDRLDDLRERLCEGILHQLLGS